MDTPSVFALRANPPPSKREAKNAPDYRSGALLSLEEGVFPSGAVAVREHIRGCDEKGAVIYPMGEEDDGFITFDLRRGHILVVSGFQVDDPHLPVG